MAAEQLQRDLHAKQVEGKYIFIAVLKCEAGHGSRAV
jgi:hypothetical protein